MITGHTGFKGAWLTLWLSQLGHQVSGLSLDPVAGGVFDTAQVTDLLVHDYRIDIRDAPAVARCFDEAEPEIVFHLAAQPLVRLSYQQPRETIETNVIGTMNVLDAIRACPSVAASVIVTTDKVYRNVDQLAGYTESDALGGDDPYSASKAMAELLTSSWVKSFAMPAVATARAGNIIGGGDVSADRLLPDLIASFKTGAEAVIRFPDSVRPWQHVLDALAGYVTLAEQLLSGRGQGSWNFGPAPEDFASVRTVADLACESWGFGAGWRWDGSTAHPHEARLLTLDATAARTELGWRPRLDLAAAIEWTVEWERAAVDPGLARKLCQIQIERYETLT